MTPAPGGRGGGAQRLGTHHRRCVRQRGHTGGGSYPAVYPRGRRERTARRDHRVERHLRTRLPVHRPGYDGPTGLGTPDGTAAFTMGPHGTLTGTVTDAASGAAVTAAQVTAGSYSTTTDGHGRYTLPCPRRPRRPRDGVRYAPGTLPGVHLTEGATATGDLTLRKLATHQVTGTVTDGSGHGWAAREDHRGRGAGRPGVVRPGHRRLPPRPPRGPHLHPARGR
ncbi:carboxypeptidase regulatory-like domain-containing protein [Streptomyces nogalater]